ncbi:MAG: glutathione S-transferase family protein [Magnetospiraceae bacterium]
METAPTGEALPDRLLFHLSVCPFSRQARVLLGEKGLDFAEKIEPIWERREEFLALNPAGAVPVMVEPEGITISGIGPLREYLEETRNANPLLPTAPAARAEVRRLVVWFDEKFNLEVTEPLVDEKFMKLFLGLGAPDSRALRAAKTNIRHHLDYIDYLAERRRWLAGDALSLADIAAAAHLSCADYLGDVPWEDHAEAKAWYARVKSRPSFRTILNDTIPGCRPPAHYANLDF